MWAPIQGWATVHQVSSPKEERVKKLKKSNGLFQAKSAEALLQLFLHLPRPFSTEQILLPPCIETWFCKVLLALTTPAPNPVPELLLMLTDISLTFIFEPLALAMVLIPLVLISMALERVELSVLVVSLYFWNVSITPRPNPFLYHFFPCLLLLSRL